MSSVRCRNRSACSLARRASPFSKTITQNWERFPQACIIIDGRKAFRASTRIVQMTRNSSKMTRRRVLGIFAAGLVVPTFSASAATSAILVHIDPNCSCCSGWVRHLKDAGFAVTVEATANLQPVRKRLGVPADLAACHTAEVGGYVLEGHVPAAAVRRLLEQRPTAVGLAVPGMPAGSPGMEGGAPQRYDVVLFGAGGRQSFMHFVGAENVG